MLINRMNRFWEQGKVLSCFLNLMLDKIHAFAFDFKWSRVVLSLKQRKTFKKFQNGKGLSV